MTEAGANGGILCSLTTRALNLHYVHVCRKPKQRASCMALGVSGLDWYG
jgi:hypothetical protein